jgi:hypothetical protein
VPREPGRLRRRVRIGTASDRFSGRPGVLACPVRRRFAAGHGRAGADGQFAGDGESGHGSRLADDRAEFAYGGG